MTGVIAIMAGMSAGGVTFTPAGGPNAGSPVALSATSFGPGAAQVTITCSETAVWNWTRTGNTANSSASVASGGSATSITFSLSFAFGTNRQTVFTVDGTAGGVTQHWTVTLSTIGL
jgi:hypothetical protein